MLKRKKILSKMLTLSNAGQACLIFIQKTIIWGRNIRLRLENAITTGLLGKISPRLKAECISTYLTGTIKTLNADWKPQGRRKTFLSRVLPKMWGKRRQTQQKTGLRVNKIERFEYLWRAVTFRDSLWLILEPTYRLALNFHFDTFRKVIQNVTLMHQSQDKTGTQVLL